MTAPKLTSPRPKIRAVGTVYNPWPIDGPLPSAEGAALVVLADGVDWEPRLRVQPRLSIGGVLCRSTRVWRGPYSHAPSGIMHAGGLDYAATLNTLGITEDETVTLLEYRQ